jgi:hypothetical protein
MRLMMHADGTWSGPGGWMKIVKWMMQTRKAGKQRQKFPGRLWIALALPSILVFIAWPLSGLCLEMTDGYRHGIRANGANVTGFTYANFNERNADDAYAGASVTWKNALDARIPKQGIMYSPEGFDRSKHDYLEKIPSLFPKEDGISRMFLTAQAETPIEGNAWGLLLQYNCSIVDKISDLTILKDRKSARDSRIFRTRGGSSSYYVQGNSSYVMVRNATEGKLSSWANNIYAVAETAYQMWPNKTIIDQLQTSVPNSIFTDSQECYYSKRQNITGQYPGIDEERVFEILLWQQLFSPSYTSNPPQYNFTVDHNITDLHGAYDYRDFSPVQPANSSSNSSSKFPPLPMTAIGVQCKSSSSVGTADIDGVRSTYSNFLRTDTPINVQRSRCAERFGPETLSRLPMVAQNSLSPDSSWLMNFFTSTAAPPPFYAAYTNDPNGIDAGTGITVQLRYLQASQLRQSMLHAYASYATQLMYNGGQGFTAQDGSHVTLLNPNITSFIAGPVITVGTMPPIVPGVLFAIWAILGAALCIIYGFRKRWTAILDGHTLFRVGAGLNKAHRLAILKYASTAEIEDCDALNYVPGLVGDVDPTAPVGKIGLVEGSVADKGRLYQ